jgi:hypothetical protein
MSQEHRETEAAIAHDAGIMVWRITFFTIAALLLIAAFNWNSVWCLLGALAAAFFAAIKWW